MLVMPCEVFKLWTIRHFRETSMHTVGTMLVYGIVRLLNTVMLT